MAKRPVKKSRQRPGPAKRSPPAGLPDALTAEQILAAIESNWEKAQERRRSRESDMHRIACRIPDEVRTFLGYMFQYPPLVVQANWTASDVAAITQALWQAYEQGCEQGYIEGRVVELASRRYVSDELIRRRRQSRVEVEEPLAGGKVVVRELDMDMDERDAVIFADLPALKREHGPEAAELAMAKRFGITDRRVRSIYLEQRVLREHAALRRDGLSDTAAADRVVVKYGVDKHGKPSEKRQTSVRQILAKGRLRKLPEVP